MSNNVKNTTFPNLLDLLIPHSCRGCGHLGTPLCERCKNYIITNHQNHCPVCHAPNPNGNCSNCKNLPPIFIVGDRNDLIGKLVHDFKYNSIRSLAHPLAEILDATLPSTNSPTTIVPLPTISRHVRERGFNHTRLIVKHLSGLRPNCQPADLLIRSQNTVQVGSDRQTRLIQATNAYALNPKIKINPTTTYILFDDVWTTGASIQAAHQLLHHAGVKNIIIAILALSNFNNQ